VSEAPAVDEWGREISRAICCWCQSHLVKIGASYWCPTTACNRRQQESSIAVEVWSKEKKRHVRRYLYVPLPKQAEFDQRPERYVLFGGQAGPGKSHGVRWSLYRRALAIPGFEALILRQTFPELEKTHLRRMAAEEAVLRANGINVTFKKTDKQMVFHHKDEPDAIIECGHMEDAAAVDKYLSTEYDCIVPDEAVKFQPDPLIELSSRARTSKPKVKAMGGAKFWPTTNPGGPAHAVLKDLFIDKTPDFDAMPEAVRHIVTDFYKPEEWAYVSASLDDNPYIDPEYERNLAVIALRSPHRYEQLRHGNWEATEGQFFGEFRASIDGNPWHVRTMVAA
jgi:phage terminase large subunit